jgi:aminoglycoside phosphotransferase family enzyme/predicted kinase
MFPDAQSPAGPSPETWDEIIAALRQPAAYAHHPPSVTLIETHISWVFLAGDRVFKLKRPMDYGFVDFTSAAARVQACQDEVRLNRRLTSGVYLGVAPIIRSRSGIRVGEAYAVPLSHDVIERPEILEWATVMRRLPARRMLDVLLEQRSYPANLAQLLRSRLLPFHRQVARPCSGAPQDLAQQQANVITENLDQLEPFSGTLVDPDHLSVVTRAMRDFLATFAPLLLERAEDGWIRDGHGDLRCEHVCLEYDGTLQIFDCVEFSQALRCADIVMDLAFLLLDLKRLGAPEIAAELEDHYRQAGLPIPPGLRGFCEAHRALVRVKVNCLTIQNSEVVLPDSERVALLSEAATYLNLATAGALRAGPALIVMSGLSGTGKTTVARSIQQALAATHLLTDAIRRDLFGEPEPAVPGQPAQWQAGRYRPEQTAKVYERMRELAAAALARGAPVILDGTFLENEHRLAAASVAQEAGVPCLIVETTCSEATALRRIAARQASGTALSEADTAIYRAQRERYAQDLPIVPAGTAKVEISTERDGLIWIGPVLRALTDSGTLQTVSWHD